MAGWATPVAVNALWGPSSIILESLNPIMWSISSTRGVAVLGKASSHGVSIPTLCTPCPACLLVTVGGDVAGEACTGEEYGSSRPRGFGGGIAYAMM